MAESFEGVMPKKREGFALLCGFSSRLSILGFDLRVLHSRANPSACLARCPPLRAPTRSGCSHPSLHFAKNTKGRRPFGSTAFCEMAESFEGVMPEKSCVLWTPRSHGWRRERDSNPRKACAFTRFPSVLLQPLGHLSAY